MLRRTVIVTVLLLSSSVASSHSRIHSYNHYTFTSSVASCFGLLFDRIVVPNRFGPSRPKGDFIPSRKYSAWRRT